MKKIILSGSLLLAACTNKESVNAALQGTCWASDFYRYHNEYCFTTDSTGVNMDGFLGSAMPDSVRFSPDSIYLDEPINFTYTLKDSMLTIQIPGKYERKFFEKSEGGETYFVSDFEYSYGRETLYQGNAGPSNLSKAK